MIRNVQGQTHIKDNFNFVQGQKDRHSDKATLQIIELLTSQLKKKVAGCFSLSLSLSLILLMTPSIPHTAHTVRRPRGDAGNMSQYPATGAKYEEHRREAPCLHAHDQPATLRVRAERAKGPGLRATPAQADA